MAEAARSGSHPLDAMLAVSTVIRNSRLARLYAGVLERGTPTVDELADGVTSSKTTVYEDLNRLVDIGILAGTDFNAGLSGVGPKTATFTLMDAAGMPLFPMDTHILRICRRLGWIADSTSSSEAHDRMLPETGRGPAYPCVPIDIGLPRAQQGSGGAHGR